MALFAAGEVVTAAKLGRGMGDTVVKTVDEFVTNSATLQDDNELVYTIPAAGTYLIDVWAYVVASANGASSGDVKFGFVFPTGTMHIGDQALDTTLASSNTGTMIASAQLSATSGTTAVGAGASTTSTVVQVHAILIATAAGSLKLQWAQASAVAAQSTTVKAGSHMIVRQAA